MKLLWSHFSSHLSSVQCPSNVIIFTHVCLIVCCYGEYYDRNLFIVLENSQRLSRCGSTLNPVRNSRLLHRSICSTNHWQRDGKRAWTRLISYITCCQVGLCSLNHRQRSDCCTLVIYSWNWTEIKIILSQLNFKKIPLLHTSARCRRTLHRQFLEWCSLIESSVWTVPSASHWSCHQCTPADDRSAPPYYTHQSRFTLCTVLTVNMKFIKSQQ